MNPVNKINPFSQLQPIQGANAVSLQKGASAGMEQQSPSSGNTSGINTNIGIGDTSYIAAQAGKKAGIGKTLGFG